MTYEPPVEEEIAYARACEGIYQRALLDNPDATSFGVCCIDVEQPEGLEKLAIALDSRDE